LACIQRERQCELEMGLRRAHEGRDIIVAPDFVSARRPIKPAGTFTGIEGDQTTIRGP
jgi:hypothetical protein